MSSWEGPGQSDEWFTPAYIFDAMGVVFDLDVASPPHPTHVPCHSRISSKSLTAYWDGFVWMNAPYGARNGLLPWMEKFVAHANGVALAPDRTSAPWFQWAARHMDLALFLTPKVKFERPDGSVGSQPGSGTVLFSIGEQGNAALRNAAPLGWLVQA